MNHRYLFFILCMCVVVGAKSSKAQIRPSTIQYISPLPGATLVSRETNVIVRLAGGLSRYDFNLSNMISAVGSRSARHLGTATVSDDGDTIVFEPEVPFEPGENVTITIRYRGGHREAEAVLFEFEFSVSQTRTRPDLPRLREFLDAHGVAATEGKRGEVPSPRTSGPMEFPVPPGFPSMDIGVVEDPGEGHIFMTNFQWANDPPPSFLLILENDGTPFFFRRSNSFALDFKKQNDNLLSYYEFGTPGFTLMDSTYTDVDLCGCGNGYTVDPHDLQVLDNEHYLIICEDRQEIDMSQIVPGGDPEAVVVGMIFQEMDRSKNVVFEWRSWDHFEITDAVGVDLTSDLIDYVHSNALVQDHDGNWLVSSRHLSEITKIDRSTGDILWRWGGKNNQFRFVGDIDDSTGFHYQHDIHRLDNGNYMLYDNGNFHTPPYSRAVEYRLDTKAMTATLVWQYRDKPDIYANFMRSSQRLPGGNTFIGWGGSTFGPITTLTEVRPDGGKAFELTLTNGTVNYRGFRFPWSGTAPEPFLWEGPFDRQTQTLTLGFDKFGDRGVALYEIYSGKDTEPQVLSDSSTTNTIDIPALARGETYRYRVRAVDENSQRSPFSNEISFRYDNVQPQAVRLVSPAHNSVIETAGVEFTWNKSSDADGDPVSYAVHIIVGDDVTSIEGIVDTSYVFNQPGNVPLSQFRWTVCCSDHEFTTASLDTFAVRSSRAGFGFPAAAALHQNFPNPFNPATTIRFDLVQEEPIVLKVFNGRPQ
jgi:hypothetical protein